MLSVRGADGLSKAVEFYHQALGLTVRRVTDDWAELSPMWNWQFSWAARLFSTLVSPHIIHFIGPAKPWKDVHAQFEPRFAQSYIRFAAEHFPDFPLEPLVMPRLAPDSRRFSKMLVKHFMSRKKMARYLARFPTDLTVHL